jgi:hypothetical protein
MRYGELHKVTDFIRRSTSTKHLTFMLKVMQFLQDLDAIQRSNPSVTLVIHTGDGIWVYYQGQKLLFLKPTQQFLNLHIFEPLNSTEAKRKLVQFIRDRKKERKLFSESQKGTTWISWRAESSEFDALEKFLKALPVAKNSRTKAVRHPRSIPGVIRQAVLEEFLANGSICPGVDRKTKRHKLTPDHRIEFDHIAPFAKRGASTLENVQVLCHECNRIKRTTAL